MASIRKVAVIGGGVAGLQTARVLRKAGMEVTMFEKASDIGGVWRSNYDGFGIQVPKALYEFPEFPATYGDFADGADVQSYVKAYAKKNGLLDPSVLKLSTTVESLKPLEGNKGWTVSTVNAKGERSQSAFDYAVVATGLYCLPHKPHFEGQESFKGKIVHSSELTDATPVCKNRNVLIIGGAKSAIDCAVKSADVGAKSTTLLYRQAHWGTPRNIAGVIPFQYVFLSRFGQGLVSWYKGAWPTAPASVHTAHSVLSPVMRPVFRIVEELFAFQLGQRGDFRPKTCLVSDFYNAAQVLNTDFKQATKQGKVKAQLGSIARLTTDGAVLSDGTEVKADVVVLGTGFKRDYSKLFPEQVLKALNPESDGLWLYRSILPVDVPRLAFIGPEVATISNIGTHGLQAEWLARSLTGRLQVPAKEAMQKEIVDHQKFSRAWMPAANARSSLVLLHQIHYHDQLCRDMGVPHRRKGANVFAELFAPYTPRDYAKIVA